MHQAGPPVWVNYVVPVVIALVLFLRLRGMRRARRLRLETLWIVPALYLAVFCFLTWEYPPVGALGWLELAAAAAVGAGIGWWRGGLMRVTIDPETHQLNQQSSPAALLFIIALILVRQGLRYEGAAMGMNVLKLTGLAMALMLGTFAASRLEIFLRAKRLLAERATAAF